MNIYDYQRPIGKIEDDIDLRNKFIKLYDNKSHQEMAIFSIKYIKHLIELTGYHSSLFEDVILAILEWIESKTNYNKSRNISFEINRVAKTKTNPVEIRLYRTIGQLGAVPHVKYHALWGTDYAITLINRMYPNDKEKVTKERNYQISLM